jgi:hypothetical protein
MVYSQIVAIGIFVLWLKNLIKRLHISEFRVIRFVKYFYNYFFKSKKISFIN